jgi:hypothetical protein
MQVKPGSRWRSVVCETEVVAVKAPADGVELGCGGHALVPIEVEPPAGPVLDPAFADGSQVGKRYVDADETVELLVTKQGAGSLHLDLQPLAVKGSKPLPSSD